MSNLNLMKKRLNIQGGTQEQRMIKDKYKTFDKSLLYSYQSALVQKIDENSEPYKALINPDKLKKDYDDKILSIDYASGYKPGDVFKWVGTETYWLIYLQEFTEDAYFRAEIRRCKYQIQWINKELGKKESTWAYIRGPVETKINSIQKHGISVDVPNWSLEIYVPYNDINLNKFQRYSRFLLDNMAWEIQVVDKISTSGIIQIIALEYFINPTLDSKEENLNDAFVVVPVVPDTDTDELIIGSTFIKPQIETEYKCQVSPGGTWSVLEKNRPVSLKQEQGGDNVFVTWTAMTSGQFTLVYTLFGGQQQFEKVIIVESLF